MDSLSTVISIASSGMRAQGERLRVVSENVANADTTSSEPGGDPYRRKLISFSEMVDEGMNASLVGVSEISEDKSGFSVRFDPAHPSADENGFVKLPNVNPLIEMANMREAARSYEANMSMLENARGMRSQLLDLLK